MRRFALLLPLLPLLLSLTGCGSASSSPPATDAAGLVPRSALSFAILDTDRSSAQLKSARSILDELPIKDSVLDSLETSTTGKVNLGRLAASSGGQIDVAALVVNGKRGGVGFARPSDEKAFDAQLDATSPPTQHEQISGWTVFSDRQAFIDAVKNRLANLSDKPGYRDAMASVPPAALVRAYVAPASVGQTLAATGVGSSVPLNARGAQWVGAAVTSASGALRLEVHAKGLDASAEQGTSTLAAQIPAGSIVALSLVGGGDTLTSTTGSGTSSQSLAQASALLGIDLKGIVAALGNETIAYVRGGAPVPEVTIASKPQDVRAALTAVGGLLERFVPFGKVSVVTVDGVPLKKVDLGSIAIYYGAFDGELVVTDDANAVSELRSKGDKLADDAVFEEAASRSGMPDANQGFLYVNLKDALPVLEGFAKLGNQPLSPEVGQNLKPLRSVLVYGLRKGGTQSLVAFLQTR